MNDPEGTLREMDEKKKNKTKTKTKTRTKNQNQSQNNRNKTEDRRGLRRVVASDLLVRSTVLYEMRMCYFEGLRWPWVLALRKT